MNKWQDMFDITKELITKISVDGNPFEVHRYTLIYKETGEKYFPKTRKYGYSTLIDAKRAAGKIFTAHKKDIEDNLLGQDNFSQN